MMDASAILKPVIPYTRRLESTTPPCSSFNMEHVELGWAKVGVRLARMALLISSSVMAEGGGLMRIGPSAASAGIVKSLLLVLTISTKISKSTGFDRTR